MIAFAAFLMCGGLLGLRLTFPAFLPLMLLATAAAFFMQGFAIGVAALVALQTGYLAGVAVRACAPVGEPRRALRRAASRA